MRFGPRFNATCANLTTLGGHLLAWIGIGHYHRVYFSSARTFKCCFDNCKASFYRSFNAIYGRLGRCASPEVILHLLSSKCMPVLLHGLDSCPPNVTELRSLEHPVTMALWKFSTLIILTLAATANPHLAFIPCAKLALRRKINFLAKLNQCQNSLCSSLSANRVASELSLLRTQLSALAQH